MRHRLPIGLRSLEKLRDHLACIGLPVEEFKKLAMYIENVAQYP